MSASTSTRLAACAVLFGAGVAATGCGGEDAPRFDHLTYQNVSAPPEAVELAAQSVTLPVGVAVKATVGAVDNRYRPMDGLLDLDPVDPSVVGIELGPEDRSFVFFGAEIGSTQISVLLDGREAGRIGATVDEQTGL